tara:strand:+ start:303 stop:503 length:201 start_codon:yes stop_codon:yes gene_type:complete
MWNFLRFTAFSVAGLAIRKSWNWLTEDIDPLPGTKEFEQEYSNAKRRYLYLKKRKEEWYETLRKVR